MPSCKELEQELAILERMAVRRLWKAIILKAYQDGVAGLASTEDALLRLSTWSMVREVPEEVWALLPKEERLKVVDRARARVGKRFFRTVGLVAFTLWFVCTTLSIYLSLVALLMCAYLFIRWIDCRRGSDGYVLMKPPSQHLIWHYYYDKGCGEVETVEECEKRILLELDGHDEGKDGSI